MSINKLLGLSLTQGEQIKQVVFLKLMMEDLTGLDRIALIMIRVHPLPMLFISGMKMLDLLRVTL